MSDGIDSRPVRRGRPPMSRGPTLLFKLEPDLQPTVLSSDPCWGILEGFLLGDDYRPSPTG